MKATIYEVAKKAGVSISTASKALNDRKDVGSSTKERIRAIAKDLNYEPSHFARAPAMRKTDNIGVVAVRYYAGPVLANPFYSKILEGIEEQIIRSNLNLVTAILRKQQVEALEIPRMVKEKSVDGIILLGYIPGDFVRAVAGKGMPVVMADNYCAEGAICSVVSDDINGAYNAVTHLMNSGHKKIAYISGPSKRISFKKREEGYRKAHEDRGINPDEKMIIFNEEEDPGYEWMTPLVQNGNTPDAVFACNDVNAILAINMLKANGIKVPDDVSVIGFDNIDLSAHFIPSISSVDIDKEMMGLKAAEKLLGMIADRKTGAENIVFPANLIIRDSVKARG